MAKQSAAIGLYEVVWPCGERKLKARPLAKRLDTLNGKTIAQLWDYLFAGDEVFAALEEKLREQYPDVKFVSWREFGSTHAANEKRGARLAAAALQRTRSRCRHLVDGLLRQLHARRVAGQRSVRTSRVPDFVAGLRGIPRPGRRDVGRPRHAQHAGGDDPGPSRRAKLRGAAREHAQRHRAAGDRQSADAAGRDRVRRPSRRARHRVPRHLRGSERALLRARMERRPADRSAHHREDRGVPQPSPTAIPTKCSASCCRTAAPRRSGRSR